MAEPGGVHRLLRWLLCLYPRPFRLELGTDLVETCAQRWRAASTAGPRATLAFWIRDVPRFALDGLLERAAAPSPAVRALRRLSGAAALELRSAVRGLGRSPGFAILAVATLALGLGAATAVFSVADAVLFRGLPWPAPEELHLVQGRYGDAFEFGSHSAPNLRDIRAQATLLGGVTGARAASPAIGGTDDPERVTGTVVTRGYFELLGASPSRGRGFAAEDYAAGAPRVVVISHALWRSRLGGRADVIGHSLIVDGVDCEIVGVMPASWRDPEELLNHAPPALWLPLRRDDPGWEDRSSHDLRVLARLPGAVSRERADAQLAAIGAALGEAHPEHTSFGGRSLEPWLAPLADEVTEDARLRVWLLLGAIGLLLFASCAAVANLFLTRTAHRGGELAIRRALGASRGRVLGQLVSEALVVCGAAALLALAVAAGGVRAFRLSGPELPRLADAGVDGRVLLAASAAALVAALGFGLAGLAAQDGASALRIGSRVVDSRRTRGLRAGLVVAQLAFAFTLLAGAGLLVNSLGQLLSVDPGFDPRGVVAMELRSGGDVEGAGAAEFYTRLLERARGVPGIAGAALMQSVPSLANIWITRFEAEGHPETWDPNRFIRENVVSSGAFAILGVPVVEGRAFAPADERAGAYLAMVNEAAARALWGEESPVGRHLRREGDEPGPWLTVVGVAADVHQDWAGRAPGAEVFVPWRQETPGRMRLLAKAAAEPALLFSALRALVAELDPALPIDRLVPLRETVDGTLAEPRFYATLLLAFAVVALVLAAVGLYGSLAYAVSREVRPLAVRMALGATPGRLVARVLSRGIVLAGMGLGLGAVGALATGRLLESLLFGVAPADPTSLGTAAALLGLVSMVACAAPARRAGRVEPASILRGE